MVSCVQKSSQENNNKAPANSANKAYDLILVPNLIDLLYFCKSGNNKKMLLDKEKEDFLRRGEHITETGTTELENLSHNIIDIFIILT